MNIQKTRVKTWKIKDYVIMHEGGNEYSWYKTLDDLVTDEDKSITVSGDADRYRDFLFLSPICDAFENQGFLMEEYPEWDVTPYVVILDDDENPRLINCRKK